MTRTVLITGGFGTIGGRLGELLHARGDRILLAGRSIPDRIIHHPGLESIELDVTESDLQPALRGVDAVVHLAALNDPSCRANPERARLVNVEGTRRLTAAVAEAQVGRFVYLSTAQVYGTPYHGYITESTIPAPSTVYASTHLEAEGIVAGYHEAEAFVGIRIRLANGFGVPSRPDSESWHIVVNDLARSAATAGSMTLRGDGREYRNFVSFGSICSGVAHALDLPDPGDGLYNLGSHSSTTTRAMAELIAQRAEVVLGFRPELRILGSSREMAAGLDYDSSRIAASGLALERDPTTELDSLLSYCAREFVRTS
jgi:UDP-glucose 4-epimerase